MSESSSNNLNIAVNKKQQELYQSQLKALRAEIEQYHGNETAAGRIVHLIGSFEDWIYSTFSGDQDITDKGAFEARVSEACKPESEVTIDGLLNETIQHIEELMEQEASLEAIANRMQILMNEVIIPPENHPVLPASAEPDSSWENPEFMNRLKQFILLLQRHNIFTSDLAMTSGVVEKDMMRIVSYVLIEIPRLKKQVLLCNQMGEATFVSQQILPRDVFMEVNKEALEQQYPSIVRIKYNNSDDWEERLTGALFSESDSTNESIDVVLRERIITRFRAAHPSPNFLIEMPVGQLRKYRFEGRSMYQIACIIGFETNDSCITKSEIPELAAIIYGEHHPEMTELISLLRTNHRELEFCRQDPELIRTQVKERYTDGKSWINMSYEQKQSFRFHGLGMAAFAALLGFQNSKASSNPADFLAVGFWIHGNEDNDLNKAQSDLQKKSELGEDPEKWKGELKKMYSVEKLMSMTTADLKKMDIYGRKIRFLEKIFDVPGKPISYLAFYEIVGQLYGEDHILLKKKLKAEREKASELEQFEKNPQLLKDLMTKDYPSSKDWFACSPTVYRKLTFGKAKLKISKVMSLLNVKIEVKKHSTLVGQIALAKTLYGKDDSYTKEREREMKILSDPSLVEELKEIMRLTVGSDEEWSKLTAIKSRSILVLGLQLSNLATRIGYHGGNPGNENLAFYEMGLIVFPNSEILKKRIHEIKEYYKRKKHFQTHPNELIKLIKLQNPQRKDWESLSDIDSNNFKVEGFGINAIASILGYKKSRRKGLGKIAKEITDKIYKNTDSDS